MSEQSSGEWLEQVRLGGLQTMRYFRQRLQQGGELSTDDREGLIDLLNYTEEHMIVMWEIVAEEQAYEEMTQRACERIGEDYDAV